MEEYDRRGGGDYDRRDARPRSESRGRERERGGGDFRRGGGDDFRRGGGDDFRRGGGGGGDGGYRRERATSSSLLVRNISYRVRPDELRRVFSYYGNIKDVYIPVDFYSKKPKGFAFVEFHDERDADEAMYRLQGYEIDGRRISIVVAKDRRKSADEMRPRGGGRRNSRSRERRDDGGRGREERGGEENRDRSRSRDRDDDNRRERSPAPEEDRRDSSPVGRRSRSHSQEGSQH